MVTVGASIGLPISFGDIKFLANPEFLVQALREKGLENFLILIDGCERKEVLRCWSRWMCLNRQEKVVLVVDNSEREEFVQSFCELSESNCIIVHHYGNVYGQIYNRQCTTFATYHPRLLVGSSVAPFRHDRRWGNMNSQD